MRHRLVLAGLAAALVLPLAAHAQADTARKGKKEKKEKAAGQRPLTPEEMLAEQKKEQVKLDKARAKANTRALFATTEPIAFTLVANYNGIAKDRDTLSTRRFWGTLVITDSAGAERRLPVQLRTRGHFRLLSRNCRFVPLKIEFADSGLKGTPFAGQKGLKLGTHCQNGDDRYDRYTRREYLAYTAFNAVTEKSFRARLASGTYVDSASGKVVATALAMFIENEDELAARLGGKIREIRGASFADLEPRQLELVTLWEYALGNTDISFFALHNARIAQLPEGTVIPLIYDFDFSGLVNAHYAVPDPRMGIRTVRERKFRGPCHSEAEYQAAAQAFLGKRDAILAAIAAVPGFDKGEQQDAREWLTGFFDVLSNPGRLKREIVESCEKRGGI